MRPVYSLSCWNGGDGSPPWVKPYRLGGCAGVSNGSLLSQDTDVRGSNAIDLITGPRRRRPSWTGRRVPSSRHTCLVVP